MLGPVEIVVPDVVLPPLRPQLQGMLSYLLLHANQHVTIDRLISALWGDTSPETARAQIHTMVAKLRRTLALASEQERIVTGPEGYKVVVRDDEFDLARFENLVIDARSSMANDPAQSEALLIEALGLWRGQAMVGVKAPFAESSRAQLDKKRLLAQEQLAELWLDLGKHHELATELPALCALYPGREQLARLLTLALYRSGQAAAALEVLRDLREVLVEEHGIEPSRETQQLQTSILRGDPGLDFVDGGTAPVEHHGAEEPARPTKARTAPEDQVGALIGRAEELSALDAALERVRARPRNAPILVCGLPGIGKTALVAEWTRRLAPSFPDGVITVDLRRWDRRVAVFEARRTVLRALKVAGPEVPSDPHDLSELYAATLTDSAALVVLDHVESSAQVRDLLLPAAKPGFAVVSRRRLDGLVVSESAPLVQIGPLRRNESVEMLGHAVGHPIDPGGAERLAELCGDWPLALRIAAARVLVDVGYPVQKLLEELTDPAGRLGHLHLAEAGASLPHALDECVADLSARALRLYRRLGGLERSMFESSDVEELARIDEPSVRQIIEELVASGLVSRTGSGRYWMTDLVRLHAAQVPAMDLRTWPFSASTAAPDAQGRVAQ
ncbi:BTAD domain-containing putative transcriptional regulator [Kribbella sp. C-35]|uniref:BTAD domain-containing putative transcriptional regulator n=1 Tax=Kribbella sp. C-35 TaxID=2789276 RepID=UPI00397A3979